jgi:ribosomal protein S27E
MESASGLPLLDEPKLYRPRRPERSPLYAVLFQFFDILAREYELRFERAFGPLRSIVTKTVERFLGCGMPEGGFARVRCDACRAEYIVAFSCKQRGFCPSCSAKGAVLWANSSGSTWSARCRTGTSCSPFRRRCAAKRSRSRIYEAPPEPPEKDSGWLKERRRSWARLIRRIYEADPQLCRCGQTMRVVGFVTQAPVIRKILGHVGRREGPLILPGRVPRRPSTERIPCA